MTQKHKKSMADISAQRARLMAMTEIPERQTKINNIESSYRYAILDHFRAPFGFTDRMYYKPLTRRIYAGY